MKEATLICKSQYVTMPDGVRLALSYWSPATVNHKRPVVLQTTRYWRAKAFGNDKPELQDKYPLASSFFAQGYTLAVADARGSGASFGSRETEIAPQEVEDIGELINWIAKQDWCDGRVATTGVS